MINPQQAQGREKEQSRGGFVKMPQARTSGFPPTFIDSLFYAAISFKHDRRTDSN
jgi:hypothetical protein